MLLVMGCSKCNSACGMGYQYPDHEKQQNSIKTRNRTSKRFKEYLNHSWQLLSWSSTRAAVCHQSSHFMRVRPAECLKHVAAVPVAPTGTPMLCHHKGLRKNTPGLRAWRPSVARLANAGGQPSTTCPSLVAAVVGILKFMTSLHSLLGFQTPGVKVFGPQKHT